MNEKGYVYVTKSTGKVSQVYYSLCNLLKDILTPELIKYMIKSEYDDEYSWWNLYYEEGELNLLLCTDSVERDLMYETFINQEAEYLKGTLNFSGCIDYGIYKISQLSIND